MKRVLSFLLFFLFSLSAAAQDAAAVWNDLQRPTFVAEKSATTRNLVLERDRIRLTLLSGRWRAPSARAACPKAGRTSCPSTSTPAARRSCSAGRARPRGKNRLEFTLPVRPDKVTLNESEDVLADIQQ
jgi:hypothetical protein